MDIKSLLPTLWRIIDRKKCAINIYTKDELTVITLLKSKRKKTFQNADSNTLLSQLQHYLQA